MTSPKTTCFPFRWGVGTFILLIPIEFYGGDKELRSICIGTSIGHRKESWTVVAHAEVLISESVSIDGFTSKTIEILWIRTWLNPYSDISSLKHEARDDSVEDWVLEAEIHSRSSLSLLSGAQASEIFSSLRDNIAEQLWHEIEGIKPTEKTILPAGWPAMVISKNTLGRDICQFTLLFESINSLYG